jgi:hypothetical protein
MNLGKPILLLALTLLLTICFAGSALAASVVVDINQKRALSGRVTPGDQRGFPVSISQPGSYRLTSNLIVDSFGVAIEITADGVTLDLNGYSIVGKGLPADFTYYPCITAGTNTLIVVRNGFVVDCGFGIQFPNVTNATIEQVHIRTAGNTSLAVGVNAIVRGDHLDGPNSAIHCPSIVVDTSFVGSVGNNGLPTNTCAKANLLGNF